LFPFEDDDLRSKLKSNAREMIVTRYKQKVVWYALLKEYQRIVKQNTPA
jgi:hypothetical protein